MIFQKITNIGVVEGNTFEQNKHIKIINTISLYGSIACFGFIVATFPLKTPTYTIITVVCTVVLLSNFLLNKYQKCNIAKGMLLLIVPIIIMAFSLFLGPIGNEYYLITELIFLFFLFRKMWARIFVFAYLMSCFVFIQFATNEGFVSLAKPELEVLFYPNIITAFILSFIGLNLFYREHTKYQELVENQNAVLKRNNEEINLQKDELENINKVKSKLFSVLSHDLRGPLRSLLTLIDMYNNDYISPEQFKKQLPNLHEKVNSTFNMTQNLLDWTKTQLKGIKPKLEPFDIADVINEVVQLFEESIAAKRIKINIHFSSDDEIISDKEIIKTILRNIIHNAIKFSFEEGKIGISLSPSKSNVRIEISDQGQGMESKIVNAFNSNKEIVSSLGTSGEKGSGLGLSITRDFIELLDGKVVLESAPDKGSTFIINIPNRKP